MMILGHLLHHISPVFPISKPTPKLSCKFSVDCINNIDKYSTKPTINWSSNLISFAIAVALVAPLPSSAIPFPSFDSKSSSTTTPFSQAQNLPTGLENGKIRPCPSINPGCVSSNPKSSSFSFPWRIEGYSSSGAAIQQLQDAILKTQKNAKIQLVEDTPTGQYLQAEVDGGFGGRDVMEFLVNADVVSYRAMATKVTYVYPFTTALGDSKGQEARLQQIIDELGWYAPRFDLMD
ncbi:thylakoid lumenal 17.9 kDa protein, chloroplastic [Salvia miltiorrhiza]|uniref:thylakoid lumenal 17.9 kDa protein, chloroplastic n=1 Tax=Salvia miltiorrhiza TaxID=226208 RepID=UPI0025AC3812|nr:thylakoid lumenal 17.9 kDa protein, chloroplastic [Salvia miltiorrhiza]